MDLEGLMHFDGWETGKEDGSEGADWGEFRRALAETKQLR